MRWCWCSATGSSCCARGKSLLGLPDEGPPVEPVERPERFLVHKLRKEFLIAAADIEWLQAQSNYVSLHVRGHDYLLRATLAALEARLDPARFARVHRSYLVNLDSIADIEPLDSGDARLNMRDGSRIPCSRRYRDTVRLVARQSSFQRPSHPSGPSVFRQSAATGAA